MTLASTWTRCAPGRRWRRPWRPTSASADPKAPLVSPAHADLDGLPPLLIHVGDHETLLDDSSMLADRAAAAGVDVELWVAPEMIHVWHLFAGIVPESDVALAEMGRWIEARLSAS